MNAYLLRIGPLAVVVALASVAFAGVPPVSYLTPDKYTAELGQSVMLHVESGAAAATSAVEWPGQSLHWFFVRAGGTQENRDTISPKAPEKNAVAWQTTQVGVTVVGFDTKPTVQQVSGADLSTFLTRNVAGAEKDPAARRVRAAQNLRVRRIQSATTMIRVPAGDERDLSSPVAQSKTGQAVEIRPLFDPTRLIVGSDFPLRVYVRGSGRAGIKVQATSLTSGKTQSTSTRAGGIADVRITHPGVWRIEFHHAQPLTNDPTADWVISSSTLTFEVPTTAGGGK